MKVRVSLVLALIIISVQCEDCVRYTFEEDFESSFENSESPCTGLPFWVEQEYASINLESPHNDSAKFISPLSSVSCVSSFPFSMAVNGVIEVNVYMSAVSMSDELRVLASQIIVGDNNVIVGMALHYPMDPDFVSGWHTLRIPVASTSVGSFQGYLSFMGIQGSGSTVLVDSFRYIDPNIDENSCVLYDTETVPTTVPPTEPATNPPTTAPPTEPATDPPVTAPPTEPATDPPVTTPPTEPATDPPVTTPPTEPATDPPVTAPPTEPATDPPVTTPPTEPATDPPVTIPPTEPATNPPTTAPPTEPAPDPPVTAPPTEPATNPPTTAPPTEPATNPPTTAPPTEPATDPPVTAPPTEPATNPPTTAPPTEPATNPPTTAPPTEPATDPPVTTPPTEPATDPPVTAPPTEPATDPPVTAPPTEPATDPPVTTPPTEPATDPPMTAPPTEPETDPTTPIPEIPDLEPSIFWTPYTIAIAAALCFIILIIIGSVSYYVGWLTAKKDDDISEDIIDIDLDNLPRPIKVPRVNRVYTDVNFNPYSRMP